MKIYLFSSAPSTEALAFLQSLIQHYIGNGSVSDQVQPVTKYTARANLSPVQVFKILYFTSAFCKTFSSPNPALDCMSNLWSVFRIQQIKCDSLKDAMCLWIVPHYEVSFKKHTRKVRYFCWSCYPWFSRMKNWQNSCGQGLVQKMEKANENPKSPLDSQKVAVCKGEHNDFRFSDKHFRE